VLRDRSRRLEVNLTHVYTGEAALTAELERRLGGHVVYQEIERIDLVHDHLTVDVRLRPGPGPTGPEPDDWAKKATPPASAATSGVDGAVPGQPAVDPAADKSLGGDWRPGV
jgi:hypothetical protein